MRDFLFIFILASTSAHAAQCPFETESLADELIECKRDSDCRLLPTSCKNDPMAVNVESVALATKALKKCNPKGCGSVSKAKYTAICTDEGCESEELSEEKLSHCSTDADCIVVPYRHCCGSSKRAINRRHLKAFEANPSWRKFDDPGQCALMGMCPSDKAVTKAVCGGHPIRSCELKY